MHKISIPTTSKFQSKRAMELANLVQRAYEQYNHHVSQNKWEPEQTRKLMGSTTYDSDLAHPSNEGKVDYEVLATFTFSEFKLLDFISDSFKLKQLPFGFIVKREIESQIPGIFVVFRGTLTQPEWFENIEFKQVPFLGLEEMGQVSQGFHDIYTHQNSEGNSIQNLVTETLERCPSNSQVFCTGHSLGAALAILATAHIAKQTAFKKPILYSFASPRVGNELFATHFDQAYDTGLQLEAYRIANSEDLVPTLPPPVGILRLNGPEMNGNTITDNQGGTPNKDVTPSLKTNKDYLQKLFNTFVRGDLQENALGNLVYQHVGEPLYFTEQMSYISTNHNMFYTYRKALL